MLIITNFDAAYSDFGKSLYASIRKNAPFAMTFFEIYNPSAELIAEFRSVTRCNDTFSFQAMSFENDEWRSDYMANRRAQLIVNLLTEGWQDILWLDADSLVKKDPVWLWSTVPFFDVATFEPGEVPGPRTQFLISTLAIRNTQPSRAFAQTWLRMTELLRKQPDICRVQEAFARVMFLTPHERIYYARLSKEWSDYEFNEDSVIWEAHSTRKFNDMRWLNAQSYYGDLFNQILKRKVDSAQRK